ncbi:HAD family hydrolase [Streptomyces sp. NPDC058284]|uniref:HAD family hydrolase n=1 Tax=unclassified Streptomyces TaxID=2593676 RepID=UPI00364851CC
MPAPSRIILLDLDGTLTDHDRAFSDWSAEFSADYDIPLEQILEADQKHPTRHEFFHALRTAFRLRPSVLSLMDDYRIRTAELVPHRPEVCQAMGRLRAEGWALGVVTNGTPDAQRLKLDVAGLSAYFTSVVISGAFGVRKPDPALFRLALDDLEADASTPAVMVGDLLDTDIAGGNAAGLTTVWIKGDQERTARDPAPTHTVVTVIEAAELLLSGPLSAPPRHLTST